MPTILSKTCWEEGREKASIGSLADPTKGGHQESVDLKPTSEDVQKMLSNVPADGLKVWKLKEVSCAETLFNLIGPRQGEKKKNMRAQQNCMHLVPKHQNPYNVVPT